MSSYGPTHCWNTSPVYKIAAYVLSIRLPTFYYKKYYQERCSAAWFSQNELCRMSKCFRLFSLIPSSNMFKRDERGFSLFWSSLMVFLLNYGSNWENNFILELEKKNPRSTFFLQRCSFSNSDYKFGFSVCNFVVPMHCPKNWSNGLYFGLSYLLFILYRVGIKGKAKLFLQKRRK